MKALVVSMTVYGSTLDYVHGWGREIKRIVIPDQNNLALNIVDDNIYVFDGFDPFAEGITILEEIEVSQELVELASSVLQGQKRLKEIVRVLL